MASFIEFEFPLAWQLGGALVLLALWLAWRSRAQSALNRRQNMVLSALRGAALLILVALVSRPVWINHWALPPMERSVAILLDQSQSMSLEDGGESRHRQALAFVQKHLGPALHEAGLRLRFYQFADGVQAAPFADIAKEKPEGKRTNLGAAIVHGTSTESPPLAIIACTDGAANESHENQRALTTLLHQGVPFIGVGFGSDEGASTLALRRVDAPRIVPPKTAFQVSAQLELVNARGASDFDLLLYRDGSLVQQKSIHASAASRIWLESFQVSEPEEGEHQYAIQVLPPAVPGLRSVNTSGAAAVEIKEERELRVLFVQGALTWDYKFIYLALKGDPSIKITGLTRTSERSVFRQNVESAVELEHGFPTSMDEIAPFRVVVLSNLKPADLTPDQQALLSRYCSETGRGILMIGGADTFDESWQGSTLEKLLPVHIAGSQGVQGLDRPFRLELTDDALRHPVFQISDEQSPRQAWASLPVFTHFGRVESAKPGAEVWAWHQHETGPQGRRILMAVQRYGAGLSASICVQNFWRWRLAKDSDPRQFDRFWRQLFRFLAESQRQEVLIHVADQELRPGVEVQVTLQKQAGSQAKTEPETAYVARVEDEQKSSVHEQAVRLKPGQTAGLAFRPKAEGLYTIAVRSQDNTAIATRTLDIRDPNLEFQNAARNMENLEQWASLSDGLAVRIEDCPAPAELVRQIQNKIEHVRQAKVIRQPLGMNGWTLGALLACLGAEWLLRKRWGLV